MAVLLMTLLRGVAGFAQSPGDVGPERSAPRHQRTRSVDDRVRQLAKTLELSDGQQSAVKKILEQRQRQLWWIRQDPSISGSARIDRFRALQESTVAQIRLVLNDEQRKKYDPLATRRVPAAPQQRSVEDWLDATTQHSSERK